MRWVSVLGAAALMACATAAAEEQPGVFAPARQINEAAMRACVAVVLEAKTFEAAADAGEWVSVRPRSSGSKLATHAWRSLTMNTTYLMRLPNGGCSFAIADGDAEALRAQALDLLNLSRPFTPVTEEPTRGGAATRYGYCTAGPFPVVASMVVGSERSKPRFVVNVFKASTPKPTFCEPAV